MNLVLFEDEHVQRLSPITTGRPAFAITCGSYRLVDLISSWREPFCYVVRPHLRALVAADFPQALRGVDLAGPLLLVNAALVPSISVLERLQGFAASGQAGIVRCAGRIAAVLVPADQPPEARHLTCEALPRYLKSLQAPDIALDLPLFEYPHEVIRWHLSILSENLLHRLQHRNYREIEPGVYAADTARLGRYVVTDTRNGPIILEDEVSVGAFCFLCGPLYLGRKAKVLEHAALKDRVALGPTTKVGGEVEGSIIEAYTNKQHHGFLGHSYLGSWVNLGAGTCNSDLKNTYGEVNLEYDGKRVSTGMQFLGCIIGDYAKTAVNTSIFTGKVIGSGSMLYGFVTTNVPSFVNYARSFGQITEISPEVAAATQGRMFARRQIPQRPIDTQLLHDMHALTRTERQLADETLTL